MKKRRKYFLAGFGLAFLFAAALGALVIWAWNSPEGTRLLLKTLSYFLPVGIDAREVRGRLRDDLELREVVIRWTEGEIRAERLRLKWDPGELWDRRVVLHELSLEGIVYQDRTRETNKPLFPGWPSAPFWLTQIQCRIDSFRLRGFSYRRADQEPLELSHLSARAAWDGKVLGVSAGDFSGPWGSGQGSMKMGFVPPSLVLDLKTSLSREYAGVDRLTVQLFLVPGERPGETPGKIEISGRKGESENLFLESEVELTSAALTWRNLRFGQRGRKGGLQSEGSWQFGVRPVLKIRARVADIDLSPELGFATNLSGEIEIEGPWNDYRGRVRLANKAKDWREANLSGDLRGNLREVRISNMEASWIDGGIKGGLGVSWAGPLALDGRLQGRKLNPGKLDPEWAGDLNVSIEGKALLAENRLSETWVKAKFSESRLQGRTFSGDLDAGLEKGLWKISQLHLRGEGFSLLAQGVLDEEVEVEARITDFGKFRPGAQGQVSAAGRVRFRDNLFSGTLRGEGKDWVLNGIRAGSFSANVQFQETSGGGQPLFEVKSRLEDLQIHSIPVKALNFETDGAPNDHRAGFKIFGEGGEIEGEIKGGYEKGVWSGDIVRLTGKEPLGFWTLQAPARIQASSQKILLRPLGVKSDKGEKIQLEANLGLEPLLGNVRAQWEELNLDRVNPWLGEGKLSGRTTGGLSAEAQQTDVKITGHFGLKGAFARPLFKAEGFAGRAQGEWGEKGLSASAALDLDRGGNLEVRVSSTEALRAELPPSGKFSTRWKNIDHALLSPIAPASLIFKGRSSGEVAGQWSPGPQFEAAGDVRILRSEIAWKAGEKPVSIILQKVDLGFSWGRETLKGRLAIVFEDHGNMEGQFELPLAARVEPFFHPAGRVRVSLDGMLREKGFLAALYPDLILKSGGSLGLHFLAEGTWGRPRFKGAVEVADGAVQFASGRKEEQTADGRDLLLLEVSSGTASVEWGDAGLISSFNLGFKNHGRIEGKAASPEPAHFSFPKTGQMEMNWSDLDLALLKPLGPEQLSLEGMGAGHIKGNWLPGFRLETGGAMRLTKGKIRWRTEEGLISTSLNRGEVDFSWKGEDLRGTLSFSLENYGALQGKFRLPIPARFPFRVDPAGEIQATISGEAKENGLLGAFLPGTVQESRGNIEVDLRMDGTWGTPNLNGKIGLAEAGAFLPGLGIRVEGLSARILFQNEEVRIESLQARSGPGNIEGTGVLWLKNWEIQRYEGKIRGNRFQVLYLPDLWVQSSPDLELRGNMQHLSVRGEVLLPEVLVQSASSSGSIRPSSDVVIVDELPAKSESRFLDVQVRIILGEKVLVKAGGIDARLEGSLDLKAAGGQSGQTTARGEIRVKEGTYSGYGLRLRIDRGRFVFAGGPMDNPELDILALRRDDDLERLSNIKVGVLVLGNLRRPAVKLYSSPAMKDEDILSYLLEGRPYDRQSANLSLLVAGAEALLGGDNPGPMDKMRTLIGIDKVDIEAKKGELSRSMVTVGKYLTPQLYVSYGYSLFDNQQILKVRYKLSKNWEVEAQRGTAVGVDLYYRIDFF